MHKMGLDDCVAEQAKKETIPKREHRHKDQTWVKL